MFAGSPNSIMEHMRPRLITETKGKTIKIPVVTVSFFSFHYFFKGISIEKQNNDSQLKNLKLFKIVFILSRKSKKNPLVNHSNLQQISISD